MKVILLCGAQENQIALANRIHRVVPLASIIVCAGKAKNIKKNKWKIHHVNRMIGVALTLSAFRRAWFGMLHYYKSEFPFFPIAPQLSVDDINDKDVIALVDREKPDLVAVSGTNLLKNELISVIRRHGKIVNLHTGISPYVKGGPNCTNWCLYLKEFGLIGNTVMWLDEGIDSGNIIVTERTRLAGDETLLELHIRVMEHAHELYARVIAKMLSGATLGSVPQNVMSPSRLFLSKEWGPKQMVIGLLNFYLLYKPKSKYLDVTSEVRMVQL